MLVREVNVGDPADKAGIEPGDLIVAVDGQPVSQPKDVQFAVLKHKPGDKISFDVMRDGIEISKVEDASPAASSGIEEGMKVLAVNRMKVKSLADVNKALSMTKDSLLLFVSDGSTKRFVVIERK